MVKILQGDCIESMKTMPDESVDMIFTDPPYGHNNNNGDLIARWEAALGHKAVAETEWRPIANDGVEANDLVQSFFKQAERLLKSGCCCCCCCCGGGGPDPQFARWSLWLDEAFHGGFKQMIVWDKGPMGMGWHYRRSYEVILVAQKRGAAAHWYSDKKDVENIIRYYQGYGKIIPSKNQHPTEKPSQLAAFFIRLHTRKGETILDPFAGSGSTGEAAEMEGRNSILIELNPAYCEMAKKRTAQQGLFCKAAGM